MTGNAGTNIIAFGFGDPSRCRVGVSSLGGGRMDPGCHSLPALFRHNRWRSIQPDAFSGGPRDPQTIHLAGVIEARNPTTETATGITGITQANPAVVTDASHGLAVGDGVYISGIVGITELNDTRNEITAADTNTFTLGDVDSSGYTAWSSGGTWWNTDVGAAYGISLPPANLRFVLKNTYKCRSERWRDRTMGERCQDHR